MARFFVALALTAAATRASAASGRNSSDPSVVDTPLGAVQGVVGPTWRAFLGVPYATPPVGDLRWRDPVPASPWAPTTIQATSDPKGCIQVCVDDEPPHICPPPAKQSEDCLYLNVYTPNPPPSEPVPVILFFHGGNFHDGAAGGFDPDGGLLYDGRDFVTNTGQIVVVAQYRLGAFGFLFLEDTPSGVHGNFGLEDQVEALRWARANVASFGGDPARVTVFGQSAGAMSISAHLSRPQTTGLYSGAIMMSNPFAEAYRTTSDALELANVFSNFTGCNPDASKAEACLRGLDAQTILVAQKLSETDLIPDIGNLLQIVVAWGPTIATDYLPRRPLESFQMGNVLDVPIMLGSTHDEAVIFVYEALDFPLTLPLYLAAGLVLLGADNFNASLAPGLYPLPDPAPADGDYRVFAASVFTDGLFICPTRNATESLFAAQPYRRSKTFMWQYSHQMSWSVGMWGSNFTECDTAVCHGSDLPEWWQPQEQALGANFTAEEAMLAADMQAYYANFAATGDPGSGRADRPFAWPAYTAADRTTINFEVEPTGKSLIQSLHAYTCNWWDTVAGYSVY